MPVRKFVYDGDAVLQEADGAGATQVEYTRTGGGYRDLLSAYDGISAKYFESDALGSTDALANEAQSVTDRWAYRAYGQNTPTVGSDTSPFTWVGRLGYYADTGIGLYLLRARYYDAHTSQFLSEDPIGITGRDANLRRYVANNPVLFVDPSGLDKWYYDPQDPSSNSTVCKVDRCGLDVTSQLKDGITMLDAVWKKLTLDMRINICDKVFGSDALWAWDIGTFNSEMREVFVRGTCGARKCANTVTVSGVCFYATSVNYILYGKIGRLCSDLIYNEKPGVYFGGPHEGSLIVPFGPPTKVQPWSYLTGRAILRLVRQYRKIKDLFDGFGVSDAIQWALAGYGSTNGVFNFPQVSDDAPRGCWSCRDKYKLNLHWRVGPPGPFREGADDGQVGIIDFTT
jgi:RHS repeat-associated protein